MLQVDTANVASQQEQLLGRTKGPSVWSLHILLVSAWLFSDCRLNYLEALYESESEWCVSCLSLSLVTTKVQKSWINVYACRKKSPAAPPVVVMFWPVADCFLYSSISYSVYEMMSRLWIRLCDMVMSFSWEILIIPTQKTDSFYKNEWKCRNISQVGNQ